MPVTPTAAELARLANEPMTVPTLTPYLGPELIECGNCERKNVPLGGKDDWGVAICSDCMSDDFW